MRLRLFIIVLLVSSSVSGYCQLTPQPRPVPDTTFVRHATFEQHATMATLSVGGIDYFRNNYSLPAGYQKVNTSGFAPFYFKLERGFSKHFSIAANFIYDAFYYNYAQEYQGYNGPFTRSLRDNVRILGGGAVAYYHFGRVIPVKNLDVFVGAGVSVNNVRYSAYPQGDSTVIHTDHIINPYLKAGARYYITNHVSLFGDVGYDKQSIFSLGLSCRFFSKKRNG